MARERWICGSKVTRRLVDEEIPIAFDEAMSAWRISCSQKTPRSKRVWSGPDPLYVHEVREVQRETKASIFLLDNATTTFTRSTSRGQEWYFLSAEILTELPPLPESP